MTAAACWEESQPNLPAEIIEVLQAPMDPALMELKLLLAIPEWEVELPGGETSSQTDILAIAHNSNGLAVLGVEAKVDEPFGPTLQEKKVGITDGKLRRIAFLESELGRKIPFPNHIRYQLLHRSVSALLTAREFHASVAVMLVHSFSKSSKWRDDFESFCSELESKKLSENLWEIFGITGPRLILGWCKGNSKYLEANLPNSYSDR